MLIEKCETKLTLEKKYLQLAASEASFNLIKEKQLFLLFVSSIKQSNLTSA